MCEGNAIMRPLLSTHFLYRYAKRLLISESNEKAKY